MEEDLKVLKGGFKGFTVLVPVEWSTITGDWTWAVTGALNEYCEKNFEAKSWNNPVSSLWEFNNEKDAEAFLVFAKTIEPQGV